MIYSQIYVKFYLTIYNILFYICDIIIKYTFLFVSCIQNLLGLKIQYLGELVANLDDLISFFFFAYITLRLDCLF